VYVAMGGSNVKCWCIKFTRAHHTPKQASSSFDDHILLHTVGFVQLTPTRGSLPWVYNHHRTLQLLFPGLKLNLSGWLCALVEICSELVVCDVGMIDDINRTTMLIRGLTVLCCVYIGVEC
jgi:hypothetical protein